MTRKQLVSACIDYQIEKGIVKAANRTYQINSRLKGFLSMNLAECQEWYAAVIDAQKKGV